MRGMSEYANSFDDLRGDILGVLTSMKDAHSAQQKLDELLAADIQRLWADNTELRDELHAVANRLENLTIAVTTSPAEVAAAIVNDANNGTLRQVFVCRTNPGCNLSEPHIHHSDGAVIRVQSSEEADTVLAEQERVRRLYPDAFRGDAS
jgi:cell division septum initiation protein DivIVA